MLWKWREICQYEEVFKLKLKIEFAELYSMQISDFNGWKKIIYNY